MSTPIWIWIAFNLFIVMMIAVDLLTFHRKGKTTGTKEALIMSGVWIALALIFNWGIYHYEGTEAALNFLAGYLIEKALSIDNLFVFLLLFQSFQTPAIYQHQVLFWGVLGAIVMRAAMIFFGITLVSAFHWLLYLLGIFLIFAAYKMAFSNPKTKELEKFTVLQLLKRWIPISEDYDEGKFFTKQQGAWKATPLFCLLLCIEFTDLVFALDSIPAVMGITLDPFIIYTSNIFAILGLRSLYFALAQLMTLFHFFHYGLALILAFVGIKMLISPIVDIPIEWSLIVIAAILIGSIILSTKRK